MAITQISKFANYFSLYYTNYELFILSDPKRSPEIEPLSKLCKRNTFLIIRHFGNLNIFNDLKANRKNVLGTISLKNANKYRLKGVHIPNKSIKRRLLNKKNMLITTSAHNYREILKAKNFSADRILISTIFQSESESAKKPIGIIKLAKITRNFPDLNFIALGGINKKNIRRLKNTKIKGVAGVSFKT